MKRNFPWTRHAAGVSLATAALLLFGSTYAQDLSFGAFQRSAAPDLIRAGVPALNDRPHTFRAVTRSSDAPLTPYWSVRFDSADDLAGFTVIDANGDGELPANQTSLGTYGIWRHCTLRGSDKSEVKGSAAYYVSQTYVDPADDWLITPGLALKGGQRYLLRFNFCCGGSWSTERLEVCYGAAPTAEGQDNVLLSPFEVVNDAMEEKECEFIPEADGVYYIGFHAVSDCARFLLVIDDIEVEEGPAGQAPGEISDLKVDSDSEGALVADLSFTAPSLDVDGNPLQGVGVYTVARDGEAVKVFENVAPGTSVSWRDEDFELPGLYTYSVSGSNDLRNGRTVSTTVYVGLDSPMTPAWARIEDRHDDILVSWEAAEPSHGGAMPEEEVTYEIWTIGYDAWSGYYKDSLIASVKGETSAVIDRNTDAGDMSQVYYAVYAMNAAGVSGNATTNSILVGEPVAVPFVEDFYDGATHNYWYISRGEGRYWGILNGFKMEALEYSDAALMFFSQENDRGSFTTGKISLGAATSPSLIFRYRSESPGVEFNVSVTDYEGNETKIFDGDSKAEEWTAVTLDLNRFKSEKAVKINFNFADNTEWGSGERVMFDDVMIGDKQPVDMSLRMFAPDRQQKGTTATLTAVVKNSGTDKVDGYSLVLSEGDRVLTETECAGSLGTLQTAVVEIPYTPSVLNRIP